MNSTAAPCALQRADHLEEPVDLGGGQRRGRLVHHDDLGVERQRLADLDHLLVGDGQAAGDPRRVERHAEALEDRGRLVLHRAPVDPAAPVQTTQRLAADEHVLRDGQVGEQRRLLVDHRDAGRPRGGRAVQRDLLAVDRQRPAVRLVHPGEDLHQGGLARAVLAEQRVHLAAAQLHRPVDQRAHRAERLRGVPQLEITGASPLPGVGSLPATSTGRTSACVRFQLLERFNFPVVFAWAVRVSMGIR